MLADSGWKPVNPDRAWSAMRFNFILLMSLGIGFLVYLELQKHFPSGPIEPVTEPVTLRKLLSVGD
ncbi:MAG: hypothetical protein JWM68_1671 [Verrucomicrobiales bacterium]|nr:hypothetical protein [Verrucomicrobiales bacterium]